MSALPTYPAYKSAGIPWLQEVPEHWDLIPNRGLVRKRKVLVGKRHKEYQLLSLTKQGIIVRDISTGKGKFSADMGTSQEVRKGDLVFCLFDVPETPRTVGLSSHDGMITGAYTVFEFIGGGSPEYFDYYYRALDDRKLLGPLYSGLRNTVPLDRLLVTKTPQPPVDEQHLIVRYLHALDTKVKRYIRTKRKLIAALQEQKQAIIQRAVTRGLNPKVKLKSSGVEWLGEVPEHWEVRPLKSAILRNDAGVWGTHFSDSGTPVLRSTEQTVDGHWRVESPARIVLTEAQRQGALLRKGDLLVTKSSGSPIHIGKTTLVDDKVDALGCCYSNFMQRIRLKPSIDPTFIWTLMNSRVARDQFQYLTNSTTGLGNLTGTIIGSVLVALPSHEEQVRIVQGLQPMLSPVQNAIEMAQRQIQAILEYHMCLGAEVVLGKVDVRVAAKTMATEARAFEEPQVELNLAAEPGEAYGEE